MASLAVTAFSTFSLVLQNAGMGEFVPYVGVLGVVGVVGFAYAYSEGGVWNQVARDKNDLSDNWAGPNMRIDDELIGKAVFAAVHKRPPKAEEARAIEETVDDGWRSHRDGVNIDGD
jgi:hypothetical protein